MSVYRALELYVNGKLQFGKTEMLGIKERGVGLAKKSTRLTSQSKSEKP